MATMKIPDHSNRLSWVHASGDLSELEDRYDQWADNYDQDSAKSGSRMVPIGAALTCRYLPIGTGPILDAGVGTGKLAELLNPLGYKDIVGIDISAGMLAAASKKELYTDLRNMAISDHMDFPDNHFSAFNVTTVLRIIHMPPTSLDELIRVTKSGGFGIFSIEEEINTVTDSYDRERDPSATSGFRERMEQLEAEGKWEQVEITDFFQAMPFLDSKITRRFFVYRISK